MNNDFDKLIEALLRMRTKAQMLDFLKGILTPKEIEEISTRLEIVKLLKKGVQHDAIAKRLGIGVATVTRGSRELRLGRFRYI